MPVRQVKICRLSQISCSRWPIRYKTEYHLHQYDRAPWTTSVNLERKIPENLGADSHEMQLLTWDSTILWFFRQIEMAYNIEGFGKEKSCKFGRRFPRDAAFDRGHYYSMIFPPNWNGILYWRVWKGKFLQIWAQIPTRCSFCMDNTNLTIFMMVQPYYPNSYPTKPLHAPLELQSLLLRSHLTLDT